MVFEDRVGDQPRTERGGGDDEHQRLAVEAPQRAADQRQPERAERDNRNDASGDPRNGVFEPDQRRPGDERKTLAGHVEKPGRGEIEAGHEQKQQAEHQPGRGEEGRMFPDPLHRAYARCDARCGNEIAQRRAGARRVVGRLVGPVLDRAGERPGDAGIAHRVVEPREFGVAAGQVEDMDRLAGRRRLADHRHRIGRDEQRVGDREIGEIRVLAGAVPDLAGKPGQMRAQQDAAPSAPVRRDGVDQDRAAARAHRADAIRGRDFAPAAPGRADTRGSRRRSAPPRPAAAALRAPESARRSAARRAGVTRCTAPRVTKDARTAQAVVLAARSAGRIRRARIAGPGPAPRSSARRSRA